MTKAFSDLRLCMTPEAQLCAQAKTEHLLAEIPFHQLRYARELSQQTLSDGLNVQQLSISKLERRADMYLSTLRSHIQAMGGDLEIVARFPQGTVKISKFSDLENDTEASGCK